MRALILMTKVDKLYVWCTLAEAFGLRPGEDLHMAALRVLRRGTPKWAAARSVLRAAQYRGDTCWLILAGAVKLLPKEAS
jgi:hypothetical protein